mmetsp:Transcript_70242/g.187055  ORF Transcript_70242/g.187055 Transcript_70242/m.187055 type:complete len:947 (+) Transcript_70242:51-2891(+)
MAAKKADDAYVEGLVLERVDGKQQVRQVDHILSAERLEEIISQLTTQSFELNKRLAVKENEIREQQDSLGSLNGKLDTFAERLESFKKVEKLALNASDISTIQTQCNKMIANYLDKQQGDWVNVGVHFYVGDEEEVSKRIGGEGAGSRDALFRVELDKEMKCLNQQAARYWGLDPGKVFFLDRDGRIVPDKMIIRDIVLPEYTDFKVRDRDYVLTLVKAGTRIVSDDPTNAQSKEKWNDFTFKHDRLKQKLKAIAEKRGDVDTDHNPVDLESVPTLQKLIQDGKDKLKRRRFDFACRLLEVFCFMVVTIAFYAKMRPDDAWTWNMRLVQLGIDNVIESPFESNGRLMEFWDIKTPAHYASWVRGPLRATVIPSGFLAEHNLILLDLTHRAYYSDDATVGRTDFCEGSALVVEDPNVTEANATEGGEAAETTATTTTAAAAAPAARRLKELNWGAKDPRSFLSGTRLLQETGGDTTDDTPDDTPDDPGDGTTGDTTAAPGDGTTAADGAGADGDTTVAPGDNTTNSTGSNATVDCDLQFQFCPFRAQVMLKHAYSLAHDWPECRVAPVKNSVELYSDRLLPGNAFSYFSGRISAHVGGNWTQLAFSTEEFFDESIETVDYNWTSTITRAQQFAMIIYAPSFDAVFILRYIFEQSIAGRVYPSTRLETINLSPMRDSDVLIYGVCLVFSLIMLLLGIRRVWCYQYEEEKTNLNGWHLVNAILVVTLIISLAFRKSRVGDNTTQLVEDLLPARDFADKDAALQELSDVTEMDWWGTWSDIFVLVWINCLFFRYVLFFFPHLRWTKQAAMKCVVPMLVIAIHFVVAFACLAVVLYAIFTPRSSYFRDVDTTFLSTVQYGLGSMANLNDLNGSHPVAFVVIKFCSYIGFGLILKNLLIAVIVSHLRERTVRENAAFHPLWQAHANSVDKFNPATSKPDEIPHSFRDRCSVL